MRKKTADKTEDSFLTRWSEKKSQADDAALPVDHHEMQDQDPGHNAGINPSAEEPQPAQSDQQKPVLVDADMPAIETLAENSDFSGFLSPGVSDELRKLALRKLFRSKVFNVRDGLDDYDDDFRSFAALGDIITSDMKHQLELAEQREQQALQKQADIEEQADASDQDNGDTDELEETDLYAGPEQTGETEDERNEDENSEFDPEDQQTQNKS